MDFNFLRYKETNQKVIDEYKKIYKHTEANESREIAQYDYEGNLINIYQSRGEILRRRKMALNSLNAMLKREQTLCQGFIWIFVDTLPTPIPSKIIPPTKTNWNIEDILIKDED